MEQTLKTMDKKLLMFGTSAQWNAITDKSAYVNSFIFLTDTKQLVVRGEAVGLSPEDAAALAKVIADEAALETKVNNLKYFDGISDGTNSYDCSTVGSLKIVGEGDITVTATADGFKVTVAHDNTKVDKVTGKSLVSDEEITKLAGLSAQDDLDEAIADAKKAGTDAMTEAQAKVASVTGEKAIVVDNTTATAPKVSLKLSENQGNVVLSQENGLKAEIDLSAYKVKSVNDKVIAVTDGVLSSTLSVAYDSTSKKVQLKGIDDEVISSFDASAFIKDGMVHSAELVKVAEEGATEDVPYIKLTFNADGGNGVIRFSVKDLVDVYDGANLKLTADSGYAADTVLDAAIADLKLGVDAAKAAGVTKFGTKTGEITVKGDSDSDGAVNLAMVGNELQASIVGLKSAAYTEASAYATAALGETADSALQEVEGSTYVEVSEKAANKLTISAKVQKVADASASAKGLAEASDVKAYVEDMFTWAELA